MTGSNRLAFVTRGAEVALTDLGDGAIRVSVVRAASAPERGDHLARSRSFGRFTVEFDAEREVLRVVGHAGRVHFESPPCFVEHQGGRVLIRADLEPGERIHGLGQCTMDRLDLRGRERRMWHEVRSAKLPCTTGIPFMLSSRGYGLLLHACHPSRFVVGDARLEPPPSLAKQARLAPAPWPLDQPSGEERADRLTVIVDTDAFDFDLCFGDDLREVIIRQTALAGRPARLPRWALGYIQSRNRYRNQEDLLGLAREFRRRAIPCDVVVIDWYWFREFGDFEFDPANWPDPAGLVAQLAAMGFKTMISLHPYVDRASRHWDRYRDDRILVEFPPEACSVTSHDAILDLTHPGARETLGACVRSLFGTGFRAWWIDQVQPEVHPVGARHAGGTREAVHNAYPSLFCRTLYEAQRAIADERVFTLSFAAWSGDASYGAALWTGDVDPDWAILREQVVIGQQLSLSGMPYWTTDMGGYVHYAHYDPEVYVRWFQWGVFCPLFRAHTKRPEAEPWAFGETIERAVVEAIRLRYRLLPYLDALMAEAAATGMPMVRPMFLEASAEDAEAAGELQFFLGDRILVAPVCESGARWRRVWLPAGTWYDGWSDEAIRGGRAIDAFAPLDRIPWYVRAGAILPWRADAGAFVSNGSAPVELRVYPGVSSRIRLPLDDGASYAYERGEDALIVEWNDIDRTLGLEWVVGVEGGTESVRDLIVTVVGVAARGATVEGSTATRAVPADAPAHGNATAPVARWRIEGLRRGTRTLVRLADASLQSTITARVPPPDFARPDDANALVFWYDSSSEDAQLRPPVGWRVTECVGLSVPQGMPRIHRAILEAGGPLHSVGAVVAIDRSGGAGSERIAIASGDLTVWDLWGPIEFDDADGLVALAEADGRIEAGTFAAEIDMPGLPVPRAHLGLQCTGYVNLAAFLENVYGPVPSGDYRVYRRLAYAVTALHVPAVTEATLELTGEDRFRAWINGALVIETKQRPIVQPARARVRLAAGWNRLALKCAQDGTREWGGRRWGFYARLVDDRGRPIEDLQLRADARA